MDEKKAAETKLTPEQAAEEKKAAETKPPVIPPATAAPQTGEVEFSGAAGSVYNIRGSNFGTATGKVLLNGEPLPVTAWNELRVKGTIPPDAKPGDVEVLTLDNRRFVGHFGPKK